MGTCIRNGRIVDPANGVDRTTDLYIEQGRIAALDQPPSHFVAETTLDATGMLVLPGVVDMAARLREPGQEYKATIASETRAAAASGITSLCCPPDTNPVVDTPAEVRLIQQRANETGACRVHVLGAMTERLEGETLSEMAALRDTGCVGVSNGFRPLGSTLILRRAMEYAGSQALTVHLHPVDFALADQGCAHEGEIATRLGLPAIPAAAETAAVGYCLALIEQTGTPTHFCRLSTVRAVRMVARARYDGLPVTADVCAHQLFLTEDALQGFNALCHVWPPLRSAEDLAGLRKGVRDGIVGAVCSDHQPHDPDAKCAPFPETEAGVSGLETLVPLMLRLVDENVLDLSTAVARITSGPAAILGIDAGTLGPNCRADICVIDPNLSWVLQPETLLSQGKNTPFEGWSFSGRVVYSLLEGRIVYDRAGSTGGSS